MENQLHPIAIVMYSGERPCKETSSLPTNFLMPQGVVHICTYLVRVIHAF